MDHPATSSELLAFAPSVVSGNVLLNKFMVTWAATPFTPCSKPCDVGIQYRTVFCVMGTNATANATMADAVDEAYCNAAKKPLDFAYCNKFSCDAECRAADSSSRVRVQSYYEDTRSGSDLVEVRREACTETGGCFVPEPEPERRTQEVECYMKPFTLYPQWLTMPFEPCTPKCNDTTDTFESVFPTKNRDNVCAMTDGSYARAAMCPPLDASDHTMDCYAVQRCGDCGVDSCGYGICETNLTADVYWPSPTYDKCKCLLGFGRTNGTGTLSETCDADHRARCNWRQEDEWGSCVAQVDGTMKRFRKNICECYAHGIGPYDGTMMTGKTKFARTAVEVRGCISTLPSLHTMPASPP